MSHELQHEADARRYTLRVGGDLASVLDYRRLGDAVALTRAFTNPPYRGAGLAGELVAYAVDELEAAGGVHIVPSCWYVEQWFDRHPDRRHLLDPRVSAG